MGFRGQFARRQSRAANVRFGFKWRKGFACDERRQIAECGLGYAETIGTDELGRQSFSWLATAESGASMMSQ